MHAKQIGVASTISGKASARDNQDLADTFVGSRIESKLS